MIDAGEQTAEAPGIDPKLLKLAQIAKHPGNLSDLLDDQALTKIGSDVVEDYKRDLSDRSEWEEAVRDGIKRAAQEKVELKNPPPYRHSRFNFPILTVATQQFNARAYPAICRPGDMVRIKVIGSDKGKPMLDQQGHPMVLIDGQPATIEQASQALAQQQPDPAQQPALQPGEQPQAPAPPPPPEPAWEIKPGAKQARADRVATYMNYFLEFRLKDWESDTDAMMTQMPLAGCAFRKLWKGAKGQRAAYIPALDLVVPQSAKDLETTPRATEIMRDVYPYQISERMASKQYRRVELSPDGDDEQEPRMLLEQHRLMDMDDDGVFEPYVVTVDEKTQSVLRIEADFSEDDVHLNDDQSRVESIERTVHYIKYPFIPDPKGGFYAIGFAHLVRQSNDVIDAAVNQMLDAGRAQIAGGGFIAAGLRLQGDNRSDVMRWEPGEYKPVNVSGPDLRAGIVERTFPNPSEVMMSLLELMLGAAKDITSVKDIVTGDAPNTAPVGTTLALIEQGLQVFTAIYKRIYRALGEEFCQIRDNLEDYGGEAVAQDYADVLDDPEADFAKDFAERDADIKPVADPTTVTSAQRIAKAQILAGMRGQGLNDLEINRRILQAAGIEDIDDLLPQQNQPDPLAIAKVRQTETQADLNVARAEEASARAGKTGVETGMRLGEAGADNEGPVPQLAGGPANDLGNGGPFSPGNGSESGMGQAGMDGGAI